MLKKITFVLLFCSSVFVYGQLAVNDFETGSAAILNQSGGTTSSVINNPNKTGLNTTDKCLEIQRTNFGATRWWEFVGINVDPDLAITALETKYLSVMVLYKDPLADIGIRFDAGSDASNGAATVRPINKYTKVGEWQEMIFEIKDTQAATSFSTGTLYRLTFHYDIGDQTSPRTFLVNNLAPTADKYAYIDQIRILDSNPLINNWVGTSADWDTGTNWSAGTVPFVHNDLVTIPSGTANDPVISTTTGAGTNTLTIDTGASLTVENGGSLIVGSTTSTGNITYKRTIGKDADLTNAWYSVSSPVSGATVTTLQAENDFANGSAGSRIGLATYKNDGSAWNYFTTTSTDAIAPGTGLITKLDNGGSSTEVSFTGTYTAGSNVGDGGIIVGINDAREVTITQGTNNFNFVGNPFLSYHNLGTFFTNNNATDRLSENTIWIWDENKNGVNMGGYVSKTSGDDPAFEIAPGQGFFVSAGSAADNLVSFSVLNQSHKTDSFLKDNTNRTEINLIVSQNNIVNSTKLYYTEDATTAFDNGYDASMFTGVNYDLAVYTNLVSGDINRKIETQSLPNKDYDNMIVPIGIKAVKGKEITISATSLNLPKEINVYLEDKQNNTLTNLNTTDYSITLNEDVNGSGRFFLRTSSNILSAKYSELSGVNIYKSSYRNLRITGLEKGRKNISLYNLLGKQVITTSFDGANVNNISLPSLATGIYLVKLQTEKGALNKKIILE